MFSGPANLYKHQENTKKLDYGTNRRSFVCSATGHWVYCSRISNMVKAT